MRTAPTLSWLIVITVVLTACPSSPTLPVQDFGFTLADSVFAAVPGTSITTSVTITPINGFQGDVDLDITNQDSTPAAGITLDPSTITVTSTNLTQQSVQRHVTIDVALAVTIDTYDLRITATSGSLSSAEGLTLTVADKLQLHVLITSPADGTSVTGSGEITLAGTLSSQNPIIAVDVLGGADVVSMSFD